MPVPNKLPPTQALYQLRVATIGIGSQPGHGAGIYVPGVPVAVRVATVPLQITVGLAVAPVGPLAG